jgi:hypothetical protein
MPEKQAPDHVAAPPGWPTPDYRMTPGDNLGGSAYTPTALSEDFRPTLALRTLHALRAVMDGKTHTYRTIAEAAGVEWSWLRMFGTNRIPNPGVDNIERLYSYLTGNRL